MVIVVSDETEAWFKYIWKQFSQINSLNAEYKLITYSDYVLTECSKSEVLLIEYGTKQRYPDSLFIPRKNVFKTDDYVWIREDLPVYRGTMLEQNEDKDYDIFYNAFVHLSRLEEWESERSGKFIHSYSFNHPRREKRIWGIPVVNYLFNELEKRIKKKCPGVFFGDKAKPIVEFSHDVDYINKTTQLKFKQTLFHFSNCGKLLLRLDLKRSLIKFKNGIDFAFKNSDYWCFDSWTDFEKGLNIKSVYYFYAKVDNQKRFNTKRWLLDPSYDIARHERLSEKCKELVSDGNRIGIHGSYFSAVNEGLFCKEKEILEDSINCGITKARQHWLNYYEYKTPHIHNRSGIEEDSTVCFNDIPGFRAGVASRYNPYDHQNEVPFSFKEIPLVVMDSHLYDYSADSDLQNLGWLFGSVKKIRNFMISVDWHQRVISSDYEWDHSYRSFIEKWKR